MFKKQIFYLCLRLFNIVYNIIPFFFARNLILRLLGNKIGRQSYIHSKARFFCFGRITIGNNTTVNFNCFLDGRMGIEIGNNVMIAHNSKIYSLGHDVNNPNFNSVGKKVIIRDNVVVFSNVLIMPGVTLGEGSVVYSGAIVSNDLDSYSIYAGIPAKKIGVRNREIRYKINHGFWYGN